ncbi:MAG TPA: hypothetical protein VFB66_16590 [Tepidisphaeraceae bacterium]|nr:hypothetical protein [Tepidisphaeraceae bacterium]
MRSHSYALLAVLLSLSAALAPAPAATPSLQGLGAGGVASAVSPDGSVVVGTAGSATGPEAFRWTAATGMVGLGDLSVDVYESRASGVSGDGSIVVGYSYSTPGLQAFRWTTGSGMLGMGAPFLPSGQTNSLATGISRDGSTIVGAGGGGEAFRWTEASGAVSLLGPYAISEAWGVSGDGSVVVGFGGGGAFEAFRWTATSGVVSLGHVPGGLIDRRAYGVSDDGSTVVGFDLTFLGGDDWLPQAFRWAAASGMVGLATSPVAASRAAPTA